MFSRLGVLLIAAFTAVACGGATPQDEPLRPAYDEVAAHSITLIEPVYRVGGEPFGGNVAVELSISETGTVTTARPSPQEGSETPAADVVAEAVANAREARFEPFLKDGVPHPARFTVHVPIQTPTRRVSLRVPFPDAAGQDVVIRLERTACYGTCPSYAVEIRGDGRVTFTGDAYVAIPGEHHRHISPDAVQELLTLFRQTDFFSLEDAYVGGVTDHPSQEVSLTIGGRTKTVLDYVGAMEGMPFGVERLEHAIDRAAGVRTWISGDATTAEGLEAEGYDFTAPAAGEALIWMAWGGSEDAAVDFVTRGAPLASSGRSPGFGMRSSAVEGAAANGHVRLLRALIRAGAIQTPGAAGTILTAAARSLDLATLEVVLEGREFTRRQLGLALTAALNNATYRPRTADPAPVVDRLLALQADVTVADGDGHTPLHGASSPAMVRRLLALGADLEAKDNYGATPIMNAYDQDVILALLDAGADTTVVPLYGQSLREAARSNGWSRVLARLPG